MTKLSEIVSSTRRSVVAAIAGLLTLGGCGVPALARDSVFSDKPLRTKYKGATIVWEGNSIYHPKATLVVDMVHQYMNDGFALLGWEFALYAYKLILTNPTFTVTETPKIFDTNYGYTDEEKGLSIRITEDNGADATTKLYRTSPSYGRRDSGVYYPIGELSYNIMRPRLTEKSFKELKESESGALKINLEEIYLGDYSGK